MAPAAAHTVTVLGLDLARVTGAAWREGDGLATECLVLARSGDTSAVAAGVLTSWLQDLLLLVDPAVVVVERDVVRGRGRAYDEALRDAVARVCRVAGIPRLELTPACARGLALGDRDLTQAQAVARALDLLPIPRDATMDEIDASILVAAQEARLAAEDRRVAA